jgi:hypothetical protein
MIGTLADSGEAGRNGSAGSVFPSTTGTKRSEMSCAGPGRPDCPPATPPPVSASVMRSGGRARSCAALAGLTARRASSMSAASIARSGRRPVIAVSASVLMMMAR